MDDEKQKHSFWTTMPGILAGVAALVTALTGVYLAMGRSDSAPKSSQTAVSTTGKSMLPPTEWPIIAEEPFSSPRAWPTGRSTEGDEFSHSAETAIVGGKFRWDVAWKKNGERFLESPYGPATEFYVATDVKFHLQQPSADVAAGLIFGRASGTDYNLRINPNKQFALYKYDPAKNAAVPVIDWTPAPTEPLGVNRIAVSVENQQMHLYINSQLVGAYKDPTFTGGKVGLMMVVSKPETSIAIDFDNFEYRRKGVPF